MKVQAAVMTWRGGWGPQQRCKGSRPQMPASRLLPKRSTSRACSTVEGVGSRSLSSRLYRRIQAAEQLPARSQRSGPSGVFSGTGLARNYYHGDSMSLDSQAVTTR